MDGQSVWRTANGPGDWRLPDPLWKRDPDLAADESAAERYLDFERETPAAPW